MKIKLRGVQKGYPNPFTQTKPLKVLPNTRENTFTLKKHMLFAVRAKHPAPAITLSIFSCNKKSNLQQQHLHITPKELATSIISLAFNSVFRCFKLTFDFTIGLRHLPHMPVPAAHISSIQIWHNTNAYYTYVNSSYMWLALPGAPSSSRHQVPHSCSVYQVLAFGNASVGTTCSTKKSATE